MTLIHADTYEWVKGQSENSVDAVITDYVYGTEFPSDLFRICSGNVMTFCSQEDYPFKPDETGERVYNLREVGYKYHMNDYAASLGLGNLEGFRDRQERVREIVGIYDEKLYWKNQNCGWVNVEKRDGCSYWLYDVLVEDRPSFLRAMKDRGVPVSVVHLGIDHNRIFGGKQNLPVQRYWDTHHVCLPIHPNLTDEDVEQVIEAVRKGW